MFNVAFFAPYFCGYNPVGVYKSKSRVLHYVCKFSTADSGLEYTDMKKASFSASTPAKLNLSLCITGKRENLHTLDMIVYPYDELQDFAEFFPSAKQTDMPSIKLIVKKGYMGLKRRKFKSFAHPILQKIANTLNVSGKIILEKRIPLGAGLGGSSACIVSAVKAMQAYCKHEGLPYELSDDFLLSLGSDVPCMYMGGVCRVRGVGETVMPLSCTPSLSFDIAIAKGGSNSAQCYALYDAIQNGKAMGGITNDEKPIPKSVEDAVAQNRNDLFESAKILNPHIEKTANALARRCNSQVFMSGSGSAVFCVKENK